MRAIGFVLQRRSLRLLSPPFCLRQEDLAASLLPTCMTQLAIQAAISEIHAKKVAGFKREGKPGVRRSEPFGCAAFGHATNHARHAPILKEGFGGHVPESPRNMLEYGKTFGTLKDERESQATYLHAYMLEPKKSAAAYMQKPKKSAASRASEASTRRFETSEKTHEERRSMKKPQVSKSERDLGYIRHGSDRRPRKDPSKSCKGSVCRSDSNISFTPPLRLRQPSQGYMAFNAHDQAAWCDAGNKPFELKEGFSGFVPRTNRKEKSYGKTWGTCVDERSSQIHGSSIQCERTLNSAAVEPKKSTAKKLVYCPPRHE